MSSRPCSVSRVGVGARRASGRHEVVGVAVNDVELFGVLVDRSQHEDVPGERILARRIEAGRTRARRAQPRRGDRVAAGKQRHVMTEPDQFLGQIRYDPLRSAIHHRRYAFVERSHLRNPHYTFSLHCSGRTTERRSLLRIDGG